MSLMGRNVFDLSTNMSNRERVEKKGLGACSGASFQSHVIFNKSLLTTFLIQNAEQYRQEPGKIVQVPHSHCITLKPLGIDWCTGNDSSTSVFVYAGSSSKFHKVGKVRALYYTRNNKQK